MSILSLHYLPCIQWMSKLNQDDAWIEQHENYAKGSYRNRCHIIGANGILPLSIPLEKGKNQQMPIREVRISYTDNWQKHHWQSIQSAYGNAPFFEFFEDDFKVHYEEPTEFLFDFNTKILHTVLDVLGLDTSLIRFTNEYEKMPEADFRTSISPKPSKQLPDPTFQPQSYPQIFLEKHGFLPNVSVLDMVFCIGMEGQMYL